MNQPNPTHMQALLQYAAKTLGVPAEQLAAGIAQNGYEGLASNLSPDSRRKLESLTNDPSQMQALLDSPQVKQLLARLSK